MVYHFFTKWKRDTRFLKISDEISLAEIFYQQKVTLFAKIFDAFKEQKIDFKSIHDLLTLYNDQLAIGVYESILGKIREVSETMETLRSELYHFYDLVYHLYKNAKKENALAIDLLNTLDSGRFPEMRKFYAIQDVLKVEGVFLRIEDEEFQAIEQHILLIKHPGAEYGGFLHIFDALKKNLVEVRGNLFLVDGRPVQGMQIKDNKIVIRGDHYTSMQNARWIQGDKYVVPSLEDPYSYFVERGQFAGWTKKRIQKVLGISSAEAVISLEVEIYPEQLYIKKYPGMPVYFAIEHLGPEQVRRILHAAQQL